MNLLTIIVSVVSIIGTLSSILFAFVSFKRNALIDKEKENKSDAIVISDIVYIKSSIDRVEENLTRVDERYSNVLERLAKVEEAVANLMKQVDKIKY